MFSKVVLGRPSDLQAHEVLPRGRPGQVAQREHVHLADKQTSGGGTRFDDKLAEQLQDRLYPPLQMGRVDGRQKIMF